jgi:hypothetical protein
MRGPMNNRYFIHVTFVVTAPQMASTSAFTRRDILPNTIVTFAVRAVTQRVSWNDINLHMVANRFDALYVTNSILARRLCSTTRKCFTQMQKRRRGFMLVMFVERHFLRSHHSCTTAYRTQGRNHTSVISVTRLTHINTIWLRTKGQFTLIYQLRRFGISVRCVAKHMLIRGHSYFI